MNNMMFVDSMLRGMTTTITKWMLDSAAKLTKQSDVRCPEETDITPYVACAFGAGVGIGMAIMYCVQRNQQPSTQITYNVQNNIQIISKTSDQIIDR